MAAPLTRPAVIADLDGTLVDTLPALRAAFRSFLRTHGVSGTEADFERWNGATLTAIVDGLAAEHAILGETESLLAEYRGLLERSYAVSTRPAPGAAALLEDARTRAARIAVVTSAPRDLAEAALSCAGLTADLVVSGDDVARGKPDPDGYRAALKRTGARASRAVALEDSRPGVAAATAAGLRCIAVGVQAPEAWASVQTLAQARPLVNAVLDREVRAFPAGRAEVRVGRRPAPRPRADRRELEAHWEDARSEQPSLFDGSLLSVSGWLRVDGALVVNAVPARYREWIAQRRGLALGIRPLGVSAVTIANERAILGRRGAGVTHWPGSWELVPSGTLPVESADDPVGHLLEELAEEAGLGAAPAAVAAALGLVEDLGEEVFDLCYRIELGSPVELPASTPEYDELALVPIAEARRMAVEGIDMAPTVRAILDLLRRRPR